MHLRMNFLACCLAVAATLTTPLSAHAQSDAPYDVLFIAIDDLNDWVGYLDGHPQTITPNIDRLAARGMAFMNAQTPSAICNAVRTALLSGMRPSTSGIYANSPDWRTQPGFEGKQTLPRFFRDAGYTTHGAGKIFHAHTFNAEGYFGYNDTTAWDSFFPELDRQLPDELMPDEVPANRNPLMPGYDWAALDVEDAEIADGQVTDWVVDRLLQDPQGPRFIGAGIYRPHLPWYTPTGYFDAHPLAQVELPPHIDDDLGDVPDIAKRSVYSSAEIHEWVVENDLWEDGVQAYLASVTFADAMVGQLLDALDASGRADRTIIVLWGDHGFHLGEKERWRKMTLWNESLHVPFVIVAPGVTTPGSTTRAPVSLMDIYPTLAALTGMDVPSYVEGRNLVPLLADPDRFWDYPVLSTYGFNNHSVVSQDYRYIRYSDGSEELYDIAKDPNEWTNLAGDSSYADAIDELALYLPAYNKPDQDLL